MIFRQVKLKVGLSEMSKVINDLDYDFSDFRIVSFVKYIERLLNLEIKLQPTVTGIHAAGLEVLGADYAVIYVEPRDSYLMQQFHILHEIGHIIQMIKQGNSGSRYRSITGGQFKYQAAYEEDELFAETFAHEVTRKLIEFNGEGVLENQEPTMQLLALYYREMGL